MLSFLLLSLLPLVVSVDVSTSVFCKNECKEYIETQESLIPYCDEAFMRASTSCGTVISCDLSEANKERVPRAQSNSSCCVSVTIKEHGDCGGVKPPPGEEPTPIIACSGSTWMMGAISVMLIVIIMQTTYIVVLLFKCRQSSAQKISQWYGGLLTSPHSQFCSPDHSYSPEVSIDDLPYSVIYPDLP